MYVCMIAFWWRRGRMHKNLKGHCCLKYSGALSQEEGCFHQEESLLTSFPHLSLPGFTVSTISSLLRRRGTTPLSRMWKVWTMTRWWWSSIKTSAPLKKPWVPASSSTSSSTYLKVRPRPCPWEFGRKEGWTFSWFSLLLKLKTCRKSFFIFLCVFVFCFLD